MKQSSSKQTMQHRSQDTSEVASAGPNGVAVTPPDYGIEALDSKVGQPEAGFCFGSGLTLQRKADSSATGIAAEGHSPNRTGLPDSLKSGVESLSGLSLDDVRVHYNSPKPAQLQALAYTQGTEIHVAPGQERHIPHEAWHVVQQKQGRVKPTITVADTPVNDNAGLEKEADTLGTKASKIPHTTTRSNQKSFSAVQKKSATSEVAQRLIINLDPEDSTIASSTEAINRELMPTSKIVTLGTADLRELGQTEPLVISGHGERLSTTKEPNMAWDKEYDDENEKLLRSMQWSTRPDTVNLPILTPQGLFAALKEKGWTRKHKGNIDLRSCWSAMPSHKPNFILQFARLINADGRQNRVIGYKGPTETLQSTGEEKVRAPFWYQFEEAQRVTGGIRTLAENYFHVVDLQSVPLDKETWLQKRSAKDQNDIEDLVKLGISREEAQKAIAQNQNEAWEKEVELYQQKPDINFDVSVLVQNKPYNMLALINDRIADFNKMKSSGIPLWKDEARVFEAFVQADKYVHLDEPVRLDTSPGKETYSYLANWRLLESPTTYQVGMEREYEMPWKTTIDPKKLSRGGYHEI